MLGARPNERVHDSIPKSAAFPRKVQRHTNLGQDNEIEHDVGDSKEQEHQQRGVDNSLSLPFCFVKCAYTVLAEIQDQPE